MWILVTYDINTETKQGCRRLRRIAKICEGVDQRVQKSVFECTLNEVQYEYFKNRLVSNIEDTEDSVRIYRLIQGKPDIVEAFDINDVQDFANPLVI